MADLFTHRGYSEAHREMATDLADDLYEQVITPFIVGRRLPREAVTGCIDDAPVANRSAVEARLLDGLAYRDELEAEGARLLERIPPSIYPECE